MLAHSLIPDNAASQKGKGTDYSISRLCTHLRQYYNKYGTEGYVLVFDFHKYFDSISHEAVFQLLDKKVKDKRLNSLTKYLVKMFGDVGLGLGSQVSQVIAISIPDKLDHILKEQLHCKYYGRYMDDGYIISNDKEHLKKCLETIKEEAKKFGVELNQKKSQIIKLSRGFAFLKIRFFLTETGKVVKKLGRKNITRERRKLKKMAHLVKPEDLKSNYNSWKAHASRCNSYNTIQSMKKVYIEALKNGYERVKTTKRRGMTKQCQILIQSPIIVIKIFN